ncbi:132 kDa protein [Durusdinium trenchii]|uniref:132 kDa protein n=1 Tax=Durusdinium trenchii TaxID=1381693 RepID=A0ABP0LGT9_9DINO
MATTALLAPGQGYSGDRETHQSMPQPECREAGARVTQNTRLADLNLPALHRVDDRRIEVIANGLAFWNSSRLALDTTFVLPVASTGEPRRRGSEGDGTALTCNYCNNLEPGLGYMPPPAESLGLHVDPALFRIMVCLRLPVASADVACPLCDAVADRMGDHARACPCGGDRTKRHHRLRSILAARAQAGGLNPVVEKGGLLPPRLDFAGAPEDGVQAGGSGGRRPADVWVGSWGAHGPAAFDLAVTSGLRQGAVAASAATGARAAEDYEARKRAHLQTAATCAGEGLQFVPLVAEAASGGWAPVAMQTWRQLPQCVAARSGEDAGVELAKLLQTLAGSLQRENARAVLRRVGGPDAHPALLADP